MPSILTGVELYKRPQRPYTPKWLNPLYLTTSDDDPISFPLVGQLRNGFPQELEKLCTLDDISL
jgi:hypothetical protein